MRVLISSSIRISPIAILLLCLVPAAPVAAQDARPADGTYVTVDNPINAGRIAQVKSQIDGVRNDPRRNIKKVIFDFNPEGKDAATESFGDCYELAKYIKTLRDNGLMTIAFVNGKVTRHTVLPVIACDDLIMSTAGQIGAIAADGAPVAKSERDIYSDFAGIIRAGPVMRMIDKDVKLVQADYKGAKIYVDQRKIDSKDPAFGEVRPNNTTPFQLPPGPGLYDIARARQFNLCKLQLDSRDEVLQQYELSHEALKGNPLGDKAMRAVRVVIEGQINEALREKVRRQVEAAKARNENTFFFVIETSAGGDPRAARDLAVYLIELGKDENYRTRTIAFVPGNAPDLAIFLAFACQEIVMYLNENDLSGEAVLGDFEAFVGGAPNQQRRENPEFIKKNLESIAEQMGHSKILVEGMFDRNLVIVRAKNEATGERKLMSEPELAAGGKAWTREAGRAGTIKEKGVLFKLNASQAKNLKIAKTINSKSVSDVYTLYGVEAKDVREAEPSWLDNFAAFLRRTEVSILLVIIGIAGLVLELKAPGLIVPGVIAAVCFVLFFWAQTQLGGQLIYLAIMLFLLGLALVGIEIFLIPGFGITGVSGILLILAGLVLAGIDKAPESSADWAELIGKMLRYGLTMAGAGVLAFVLSRYLPKIPYANRLMLVPPEDKPEVEEASPLPGVDVAVTLLGQVGTATSMLRPAGLAKFGDRYIDVVTEGDFIAPGTSIQVVEVEGTRIVVKRV
jgi:membrane-bound serine protease (ClpP class)